MHQRGDVERGGAVNEALPQTDRDNREGKTFPENQYTKFIMTKSGWLLWNYSII